MGVEGPCSHPCTITLAKLPAILLEASGNLEEGRELLIEPLASSTNMFLINRGEIKLGWREGRAGKANPCSAGRAGKSIEKRPPNQPWAHPSLDSGMPTGLERSAGGTAPLPCSPGRRKGWHSSGMPAAVGTWHWAPGCTDPARGWLLARGARWLSLLRKGLRGPDWPRAAALASCWGTGPSSRCPLPELTPSRQGKLRHTGLGHSKAASLPLALAGNVGIWDQPHPIPSCHLRPPTGNTPLILEGLNPAEGSSFPAASSHQRHPRAAQAHLVTGRHRPHTCPCCPPCLSRRREDLGGQGLWHSTADPHPHESFPKTPHLDHLSLSMSAQLCPQHPPQSTRWRGCYLNICGV